MTLAYIGLGSNLDNPELQVVEAITELDQLPESTLLNRSSLYRSAPQGPQDQPDFINAVIKIETELPPEILLEHLQQIEHKHGRLRSTHWGPRTLDLDLLLYGNMKINTEKLTLPHAHMASRSFVLEPLLEIETDIEIPGLGGAAQLYHKLRTGPLARIVP
jgi:2-amino-4-hydroxy-6-hydroxymethyldihydropteridine diphosphokinase